MPLSKMGFNTANKIVVIYSKLLSNLENKNIYEKYSYSELNGYDIIDISNAMKLMIAYRYFNLTTNDTQKLLKLNEYITVTKTALFSFSDFFYPDEIVLKLKQIDTTDSGLRSLQELELTNDSENFEMNKLLYLQETPDDFFKYCTLIGNDNPYFWENIYHRIGLTWETNNEEDRIYFIIKHKDYSNQKSDKINNPVTSTLTSDSHNRQKNFFQFLKDKFFSTRK